MGGGGGLDAVGKILRLFTGRKGGGEEELS